MSISNVCILGGWSFCHHNHIAGVGVTLARHRYKQPQIARNSDPRLLAITSQVWLVISIGWLISVLLGFLNVYVAYASWILWPNLVAIWGNRKRRLLVNLEESGSHGKKKAKK